MRVLQRFNVSLSPGASLPANMKQTLIISFLFMANLAFGQDDGTEENPVQVTFEPVYVIQMYNGAYGCSWPVGPLVFEAAKESIRGTESSKRQLEEAKKFVSTQCLLTTQISELLMLFSSDDQKADLAKDCYGHTYDIDDFENVYKTFSSKKKVKELEEYVISKKKY